jgi:hypothetical protein
VVAAEAAAPLAFLDVGVDCLGLLVVATRCAEELDLADQLVVVTAGAVVGVPLVPLEAAADRDEPALREALGGG